MKTPSIVTGNDFVMKVYVYQPRYIDNNTVMEEFSLRDCSSIKVFLINNADSYCVEYTLDENEDNLLKVVVDFKLPIGSYGLEIIGKDSQGKNWRFKAKKGEMFNIIDATSGSDFNNDLLEDGLYVTAQVGILGIDVDDFVTQADLELLSISWNDLTDKPTIPTNMSQLNNDAGYVNDLSNYYTKREVDERDRYATSPMVDIFSDTQHTIVWNTDTIFVHNYNSVQGATLTINANLTVIDTVIINWQYKIVVTVNHHCTYEWITDDVVKLMFDESFTSLDIHNSNGYTFEIYADQGITIREKLQNVETQLNNNYYTKSDIDNAGFITQHQSLADYPTKSDIENASYVTSDYLSQQSYLTQHQSLDNYVTKEDLNNSSYLTEHQDLSSYVTYDYLSSQSYLTQHQSLDNYVTKEDLNNASYITEHQDLSSYVTYDYLSAQSYLTEHQDLSSYVTYDFLSSQSYLTQHQSLDNYVTKSDLDNASYLTEHQDLSSYVTYDFLSSQAYLQQHQDLSIYVTYDYLSAQSYLTQHQSLNGYATESWVNDKFEDILGVDADGISGIKEILEDNDTYTGILKEIVKKANAEDVYTKSDIVNASYVTSDFLSQQSYLQQHQSLDNYVTYDFLSSQSYLTEHQDLSAYVTKEDLDNASYLTEHQDLSSYVTYDFLSSQSYLTQHQSLDNYVTKEDLNNASYLSEHQDLSSYVTYDFLSSQSYLTQHQSLDNYVTKEDLNNASYITSDYLSQQSYLTQHQSLSDYVTKNDLENASYLTEYQDLSSYVTYDYLSAQSYLTQHQSLDNYYTKTDIDNASYITQTALSNMGYLTSHQSLSDYVTKTDIDNASYVTQTALSNMGYIGSSNVLFNKVVTENYNVGYLYDSPNGLSCITNYQESLRWNRNSLAGEINTYSSNLILLSYCDYSLPNYIHLGGYNTVFGGSISDKEPFMHFITKAVNSFIYGKNFDIYYRFNSETIALHNIYAFGNNLSIHNSNVFVCGFNNNIAVDYQNGNAGNSSSTDTLWYDNSLDKYNSIKPVNKDIHLFVVGNGESRTLRHNAFDIRRNGQIYIADTYNGTPYCLQTKLNSCVTKTSLSDMSYVASSTSGLKIEVVSALPANPDNNCIYIIQ